MELYIYFFLLLRSSLFRVCIFFFFTNLGVHPQDPPATPLTNLSIPCRPCLLQRGCGKFIVELGSVTQHLDAAQSITISQRRQGRFGQRGGFPFVLYFYPTTHRLNIHEKGSFKLLEDNNTNQKSGGFFFITILCDLKGNWRFGIHFDAYVYFAMTPCVDMERLT